MNVFQTVALHSSGVRHPHVISVLGRQKQSCCCLRFPWAAYETWSPKNERGRGRKGERERGERGEKGTKRQGGRERERERDRETREGERNYSNTHFI